MTSTRLLLCSAAFTLAFAASVQAQGFVRMEMIPIASTTLTTQQILAGETTGKPAGIAGQLRIPKAGTDKLPAIILVHGSGGLSASADAWAKELNSIGLAVLVLDSFAGRNITSTVTDQSQLDHLAMMVDAYRALDVLSSHPRIDPARVAVIGFSKGAVASVYSANQRFRKQFGGANEFAAHIGLYTPCNVAYRGDDKVTGKPIRFHHGIPDDWVPIAPCRDYVTRLKQAGADVSDGRISRQLSRLRQRRDRRAGEIPAGADLAQLPRRGRRRRPAGEFEDPAALRTGRPVRRARHAGRL